MQGILEHIKFLKALLDIARQRGDDDNMDYLMERIDKAIDGAYEAGATADQIDAALA